MKLNVLSSERRDKIYFGYAESRKTPDKVEHNVRYRTLLEQTNRYQTIYYIFGTAFEYNMTQFITKIIWIVKYLKK